jgi:hypothetical protein
MINAINLSVLHIRGFVFSIVRRFAHQYRLFQAQCLETARLTKKKCSQFRSFSAALSTDPSVPVPWRLLPC